jgi:thiol-disulfide isomerase/thioredoxin
MRNIFILVAVAISFASCDSSNSISGVIKGAEGKTIYLESLSDSKVIPIDSTVVGSDGSFSLKSHNNLPLDFYRIYFKEGNFLQLITDSSEHVEIKGEFANLDNATVEGSPQTVEYMDLVNRWKPLMEKIAQAQAQVNRPFEDSTTVVKELDDTDNANMAQLITAQKEANAFVKGWLEKHSASLLAISMVQNLDPRFDFIWYQRVLTDTKPTCGNLAAYKSLEKLVGQIKNGSSSSSGSNSNIAVGKPAPEIALPALAGETKALSSLLGKVVLLDFWASWCGPCRKENPNVVAVYNKYASKGFDVFSVSLDENKAAWDAAIKKDGLIWKNHVSDLGGWRSSVVPVYEIESIPFPVLIDKDGKIVAMGESLRGAGLENELKKLGL